MRKLYFVLLPLVVVLVFVSESEAQFNRSTIKKNNKRIANYKGQKHDFKNHVYTAVGVTLNALNYYGDLAPLPSKVSTDISFTKPAFGITLAHRFGPRYTLLGSFMYGTLKGADATSARGGFDGTTRQLRNLSFRNRIKELSLVAVFDLFENQSSYISRVKWTPYAFVGIAAFLHNPQAKAPDHYLDGTPNTTNAGQWVDLQPLGTEGQYSQLSPTDANYGIKPYSLLQVAIPFGVGARFKINEVLDLWADIGFRYTFTDYLDDVSGNYVDLYKIKAKSNNPTDNKLAQALSYRTNELGAGGVGLPPGTLGSQINTYPAASGSYTGYQVVAGYGIESKTNKRGSKSNPDVYMVTSVKLTYILGATFHKAKFR